MAHNEKGTSMARAKSVKDLERQLTLHLSFSTDRDAAFLAVTQQILADNEPTLPFTEVFPSDNVLAIRRHVSSALVEYVMLQEERKRKRLAAAGGAPT